QMAPGVAHAEQRDVDFKPEHRLDVVEVLREGGFVDLYAVVHELLPEIGEQGIVDNEIRLDRFASDGLLANAHIAFGGVLLRVACKRLPRRQHPSKPSDVEPAGASGPDWPGDSFVGLD